MEEEEQNQSDGSNGQGILKAVMMIVLGVAAGGVAVFGVIRIASGTGQESQIADDYKPVMVFERVTRTRRSKTAPGGLRKWVVGKTEVKLNPKLSRNQITNVKDAIEKRRTKIKADVGTYLRNKNDEFVHKPDAKEKVAQKIRSLLEEFLPADWIEEVVIESFQPEF